MNRAKWFVVALLAVMALSVAAAPRAKADGWYGGAYVSGGVSSGAYWDPAGGYWVYPSYTYRPAYSYYPAYATYGYTYPSYYYPYYSRPAFSVGFSYGYGGGGHYGGYGSQHWHR